MSKKKEKKKDKKKDRKLASQQVVTPMQSNDETPWVTNEVICQPTDSQQIIGQVIAQSQVVTPTTGQMQGNAPEPVQNQQKKVLMENNLESKKNNMSEHLDFILCGVNAIFDSLNESGKLYKKFLETYKDNVDADIKLVQLSGYTKEQEHEELKRLRQKYEEKATELAEQTKAATEKRIKSSNWVLGGILGIGALLAFPAIIKAFKSNGNQMNLMTMDDLIMKAPVKRELESHYFEVLRAIGEMGDLKNEEKELWKQLQLLKKIFEALIFKGVYGCSLGKGAKAVKKLVNEIKKDPNGTGRWMKGLDGKEKEKLYHQVREICEYLDGHKNTTEIKQS